jgi:hypothetical protein
VRVRSGRMHGDSRTAESPNAAAFRFLWMRVLSAISFFMIADARSLDCQCR